MNTTVLFSVKTGGKNTYRCALFYIYIYLFNDLNCLTKLFNRDKNYEVCVVCTLRGKCRHTFSTGTSNSHNAVAVVLLLCDILIIGNLRERDHLKDPGVDGITLKEVGWWGMD